MMMPITSITASLADCLPKTGSPSFSDQAQFERALAHAADSLKNDAALASPTVPVAPAMGVQRAATQMSPLGDRVVQTISAIYPDRAVNSAALDQQVGLLKGALHGPQKLPAEGDARTGMSGVPQGGHDFETMIAGLRDMYNGVTQVGLLSKGVSGITSSVNKLLKEG
ncbi:Nodulation protein nolB [Mesorhizobium metallidurans STM 2683]|uniref:Nodulation protein nolB n=1 Tax=Mesorhizobium metallidurans STM 2683 TaxID=1297569 RepID=M5END2_9HYPH|nr:nodulation protein NolB [Mesorhizobium metallidurans]CCV05832.1 Nodulation protein nolB [Mesorhizobium metallidurans STM 2683]